MRLYSLTGATAVTDPEYGHFDAHPDGFFDFPDDLSTRLHRTHHQGKPLWEDDVERQQRLLNEEMERRRDPATLMAAVQQLVAMTAANAGVQPPTVEAEPVRRGPGRPRKSA